MHTQNVYVILRSTLYIKRVYLTFVFSLFCPTSPFERSSLLNFGEMGTSSKNIKNVPDCFFLISTRDHACVNEKISFKGSSNCLAKIERAHRLSYKPRWLRIMSAFVTNKFLSMSNIKMETSQAQFHALRNCTHHMLQFLEAACVSQVTDVTCNPDHFLQCIQLSKLPAQESIGSQKQLIIFLYHRRMRHAREIHDIFARVENMSYEQEAPTD